MYNVFIAPLTTGHQYTINLAMWFIAPLFFAEVANLFIRMLVSLICPGEGVIKETALFIVYLVFGAVAISVGGPKGLSTGWLLLACRTLFFMACFGMGRYYKAVLEAHDNVSNLVYFSFVLVAQMVVVIAVGGNYTYMPSWCCYPNGVLGTYAVTILGIAFLLRICKILGPYFGHTKAVLAIADNSFSIMCHHLAGFFILNCLLLFVSNFFGVLNSFDFDSFSKTISYAFTPRGCPQFDLVYGAFGIGFSLLVHTFWVAVKTRCLVLFHRLKG